MVLVMLVFTAQLVRSLLSLKVTTAYQDTTALNNQVCPRKYLLVISNPCHTNQLTSNVLKVTIAKKVPLTILQTYVLLVIDAQRVQLMESNTLAPQVIINL